MDTADNKKKKMNLPNRLTLARLCLVPFCVAAAAMPPDAVVPGMFPLIAALIFAVASFTDMLDGRIARKYNLITDFGKFLDPLADKFIVIGTMMAVTYSNEAIRPWFFWVVLTVIFREFAVTSLRLLISTTSGDVVAAAMPGKIKTVVQMICVLSSLVEPVILRASGAGEGLQNFPPVTVFFSALTVVFTLWSGIGYFTAYAKNRKEIQ